MFLSALIASLCLASPVAADCVVLLHGLARSAASMGSLEKTFRKAGYQTVAIDYPSRRKTLPELARFVMAEIPQNCRAAPNVHFVTHSMGGILLRYAAARLPDHLPRNMGRTVMLGPPNQGSEIVDHLGASLWFQRSNGPAGGALDTGAASWPKQLGAYPHALGVIAGNQSIEPYWSVLIAGPDDGKVSVASTKLDGMDDHIVLPVTHTFMMYNPEVKRQAVYFLRHGRFESADAS